MSETVDVTRLNQARNLLNVFALSRIKAPDQTLADLCRDFEEAIYRDIAILSRLARLPVGDERRRLIHFSYVEADSQFKRLLKTIEEQFAIHGKKPALDRRLVDRLKSFHGGPTSLRKQLVALLFHGHPPDAPEVWLQRVYAAREVLRESMHLDSDRFPSGRPAGFSRTIIFEPEYRQAGISVLSYFGEVIQVKYPQAEVRVRIEQSGSTVTLVVETDDGEVERIERELSNYGLVVAGKLSANEYVADPIDALRLQHKLDMAQLEVRHTKELLSTERRTNADSIASMKNEIAFIRSFLDKTQYEASQNAAALRSIGLSANVESQYIVERLIAVVCDADPHRAQQLESELRALRESSPSTLEALSELVVKGAVQGAAGNYLYNALQAIQRLA